MYIERYNNKPKIVIFSGAGLSAESGISTFRDSNGLWENHKIEDVCLERTWKKNFNLVHRFYNDRREQLATVEPNEAHETIKRLYDRFGDDLIIVTQNVDNMLERTGIPKDNILHLHGFLTEMHCTACGHIWDIGYKRFNSIVDRCPECSSKNGVKPNIVFFGGSAPMYTYLYRALDYLEHPESIIIVVGTSNNVIDLNTLLKHKKAYKILIDIDKIPENINSKLYNKIILTGASLGMSEAEQIINGKWKF